MRRLHRLWAVLAACLLVACGSGGGSRDDSPATQPGDSLRIAVGEDIWPLTGTGPSSKHFAAGELSVGVYEPLLTLGTDFTVKPGLAERWELVDPQRWRFHLRPGVTFHDGRPFGAEDVVWSWTGRQFLPGAVTGVLDAVVKVDDLTVDFVLRTPDQRLPEKLVHPEGPIVPRNSHNDATPPVGTGPYKVVEYRPSQRVVVERNDAYWGEKAKVRQLTFLFRPDPAERLQALKDGDVDVAANVPWASAGEIAANKRFHVVTAPVGATQSLSYNTSGTPPDLVVRRAVALALDRRAYVADVLKGNGEPGRTMSPPAVLGAAAASVDTVPFDPAQARRVLDDAGWQPSGDGVRTKNGQRLTLTLVGGAAVPEAGLRWVQTKLREVGMEVAVKYAADITTYQEYRQKGYDFDLTTPNQNDANPAFLVAGRASPAQATAIQNATTREAVQQLAADAMEKFITEDFVVVPLAHVSRIYAVRQGVNLADPHPSGLNQSWAGLSAA